ncbi:MFS transporter [Nocardioides bruguierae]|uniref:MFS transporter n=1 Tax=Nocardioides bruguierae TaxID=2945102 RepID=A0A9X2DB02_9ACTN|nr:MFS transporter [Nocardioides bruguierae]MCM0622426.1 MFS transporter [Nocardioides bruguierae]
MVEQHVEEPAHPEQEQAPYEPNPRRWRILGVSLVVGFMSLLDVSIVNVAIPSMSAGLDASEATIQWVVSGYALAFGLTLVAGGRLGDAYGRRTMMLIGLTGFVASSAFVGFAPSAGTVVLARLLQGASAGLLTPQNSGLIQQLFRGRERGKAFGFFGLTVSIASATGPVIGGLIIALAGTENGWRWLFLINVPIGLVAFAAIWFMVPRTPAAERTGDARIDVLGSVLLGATVICLLLPVVSLENGSVLPMLLLVGVPAFGWAFVRWEARQVRTGRPPLLDLRLLRHLPGYVNGMAVGALYFTGFTGLMLVASLHLQDGLGYSALQAGLMMAPFAVGSAVAAPLAGRVVTDVGRKLTVGALSLMITGTVLIAIVVPLATPIWAWLPPVLLLTGLGAGAVVSPNITLTLQEVPPEMGGAAGGALQTGQRIGASIGAALAVSVYTLVAGATSSALGLSTALAAEIVLLLAALAMAVRAWRR